MADIKYRIPAIEEFHIGFTYEKEVTEAQMTYWKRILIKSVHDFPTSRDKVRVEIKDNE